MSILESRGWGRALGVIFALCLVAFVVAVWTGDDRWAMTGVIVGAPVLGLVLARFLDPGPFR